MNKAINIAIDGHSSTGKSTLAKSLAKHFEYSYIDTGAMYRACALYVLNRDLVNAAGGVEVEKLIEHLPKIALRFNRLNHICLNGESVEAHIRDMRVSELVSHVAAIPAVRRKLVEEQRSMAETGGVVMDGRDIGTVVLPNAELKIFMTASAEIRARRRQEELKAKGQEHSLAEVLQNINERDRIDSQREDSPLRRAEDALLLDNSELSMEDQLKWAIARAEERGAIQAPVVS